MKKKLRYGLIGAGSNAEKKHLTGYSALPHVELVAVCDVNQEKAKKMAEKYQISNLYTNYTVMLDREQLDLVSVCTPNLFHADISIYALNRGVHVHCEKPLAISAVDSQKILDAKRKSGKMLMIGLNNRMTNEAVFIKQYIDEGNLGDIYQAKAGWRRRSGIPGRGTWFTNKQLSGGGVMVDLGVHYLDLVLYLMGNPEPSYITGSTRRTYDHTNLRNRNGYAGNPNGIFDVEDSAVGYLQLKNGGAVSFEFSWASNIEKDTTFIELIGTKGGISLVDGRLKIFSEQQGTCVDIVPQLSPNVKLLNEFEHFTSCILSGEEPLAPPEHGVYMMEIIDQFYRSASLGQPVLLSRRERTAAVIYD
ncbi:Gfo/Idh/MocA family protein [Paenibacillus periandrae]|uniref:Gfo/Idh/MocA family protein n=1 Tax=Paenibacillus periandrae TaxID=1761741 RepID=UPI001F0A0166|nr:Gfo/Idh/MocA family oxidoreductase [Paenibacillus periandrae]